MNSRPVPLGYNLAVMNPAGVAEVADARDLKSSGKKKGLFPLSPIVPATY
jgi:hypothetical protein